MFNIDQLITDCRTALTTLSPAEAVKKIAERAVCDVAAVLSALGSPIQSGIKPLYRSSDLTILNVVWAPGMSIYPHDHRMWAVIAVYEGREQNTFYKRSVAGLVRTSCRTIERGEAVILGAKAIHSVSNPLVGFSAALQIYGGDFFNVERSEFDPITLEERPFDIERATAAFVDANPSTSS